MRWPWQISLDALEHVVVCGAGGIDTEVEEGSAAGLHGLQRGDRVMAVQGRDVSAMDVSQAAPHAPARPCDASVVGGRR